jgi:hypothetical protein
MACVLHYCHAIGRFSTSNFAAVERSTVRTGCKEGQRPQDQEWHNFHVQKDPSLSRHNEVWR